MEVNRKVLKLNDSGEVYYEGKLYKFPIMDGIVYYIRDRFRETK